ncbi:MAG TPA: universal stress protein [Pedococcus sp.]|jgi:nucleotide-binding universal stress UspA family protein|nr:universal stress protein [Pedococcus sp.]
MSEPGAAGSVVVVGFDHHPPALAALSFAAKLAVALGDHLRVVHVLDVSDAYPDPDADHWEQLTEARVREVHDIADRALAGMDLRWSYEARRGPVAGELLSAAREVDATMLVLGAARAGHAAALVHLVDRPVLPQVLHGHLDVPILIVPAVGRSAGLHAQTF